MQAVEHFAPLVAVETKELFISVTDSAAVTGNDKATDANEGGSSNNNSTSNYQSLYMSVFLAINRSITNN
jgi:hypothetical protein